MTLALLTYTYTHSCTYNTTQHSNTYLLESYNWIIRKQLIGQLDPSYWANHNKILWPPHRQPIQLAEVEILLQIITIQQREWSNKGLRGWLEVNINITTISKFHKSYTNFNTCVFSPFYFPSIFLYFNSTLIQLTLLHVHILKSCLPLYLHYLLLFPQHVSWRICAAFVQQILLGRWK